MFENVIDLSTKLKTGEAFPSLWPTESLHTVGVRLMNQQPRNTAVLYDYAVKTDIIGEGYHCVILQPNNTVLYQSQYKGSSAETFEAWVNRNLAALNDLTDKGVIATIVGKMGRMGDAVVFACYYVIQGDTVFLDVENIQRILELKIESFSETLIPMPVNHMASLSVNSTTREIKCPRLEEKTLDKNMSGFVALPVIENIGRITPEGQEPLGPRLLTLAVHMRYMAFVTES